jgi:hypothetical protein
VPRTAADVLRRARANLTRHGWTHGVTLDPEGQSCAVGHICRAAYEEFDLIPPDSHDQLYPTREHPEPPRDVMREALRLAYEALPPVFRAHYDAKITSDSYLADIQREAAVFRFNDEVITNRSYGAERVRELLTRAITTQEEAP